MGQRLLDRGASSVPPWGSGQALPAQPPDEQQVGLPVVRLGSGTASLGIVDRGW